MYLSTRAKFRIGIGLITLPAFAFGLLIGVLLILLLSARPVHASDNRDSHATATAKITLILRENDKTDRQPKNDDSLAGLNTVVVEEGNKIIIEPI